MRSRVKGKNTRHLASGRHIPHLLQQGRLFESKRNRHPKQPTQMVNNAEFNTNSWHTLFILLILSSYMIREVNSTQGPAKRDRINNKLVTPLPANAICTAKNEGISYGKVCEFDNKIHFLKIVPPTQQNSNDANPTMLSNEAFNRQFVKEVIGANVPVTHFYKSTDANGKSTFFISSEKVEDLQPIDFTKNIDAQLGENNLARLAIASTFIQDLHSKNVGYNKDGLMFIDVDSVNTIPDSIPHYLQIAIFGIKNFVPPLSTNNLRQMIQIYQKMRSTPLPPMHNNFHLTKKLFNELINIYTQTCKETYNYLRTQPIQLSPSQPSQQINLIISERFLQHLIYLTESKSEYTRAM